MLSDKTSRFQPRNSNARILTPPGATSTRRAAAMAPQSHRREGGSSGAGNNLGLTSQRARLRMVKRLREQGITNEKVLAAMQAVPRHLFVDEGLASHAYDDAALPIGFGQTISQPYVVARMVTAICEAGVPGKILEVGGGCGYQAAVLAQLCSRVTVIERVRGLCEQARLRLQSLGLMSRIRLVHGDGMLGYLQNAPYDGILVAAAGPAIPSALLEQLSIGGRLIAPEGDAIQQLIMVERTGTESWHRTEHEFVRFVPLKAGVQA